MLFLDYKRKRKFICFLFLLSFKKTLTQSYQDRFIFSLKIHYSYSFVKFQKENELCFPKNTSFLLFCEISKRK